MTSEVLKFLHIEYLRGSVLPFSLPFEKGKNLTVIYGENAAGKSTICDAFEFLGKGKVGSLENRGLGKTFRYWPSLGKAASQIAVKLETSKTTCKGTVTKNEVVIAPIEARPRVEVLRKYQILSLIEADPAERYEAIKRFIDVSGIEESESSLRTLIRDLKESRTVAVARVLENENTIRQFWETAGKPQQNPLEWARAEAARDTNSISIEIKALDDLQRIYSLLAEDSNRLISSRTTLSEALASLNTAKNKYEEQLGLVSATAGEIVEILEVSKAYFIKEPDPKSCPLCESPEKVGNLAKRVEERLKAYSLLQAVKREWNKEDSAVKEIRKKVQLLEQNQKENAAKFQIYRADNKLPKDLPLPTASVPEGADDLIPWLKASASLLAEWKKAEADRLDKQRFINTLKKSWATWNQSTKQQKELDILLPRLDRALEVMVEERRQFTDDVLKTIANRVGELYEQVHPGEGLNKISIVLDPKQRASLEIGASFGGQEIRPQAYFSDSHLDTLGLCVFIALACLDKAEETILVLDDILASVDEPHVERLIEMIYAEAAKFRHCIITTHYRPWKHKLRWGWLQNGQCQFVELRKWKLESGLALIRSIPDIERLSLLLSEPSPDLQLICAKAGVILEAALDFLTLQYQCDVPRKADGLYTLGDLLPKINKKLREALRIEIQVSVDSAGRPVYNSVALKPFLDELTRIAQTRNVFGCHFNKISFELLDSDALEFGRQVLGLMNVLTDVETGWPKNGRSGEYWATAKETRKLFPYEHPH